MTVSAKKLRVAINGFGRIGRQFLRCWEGRTDSNLEVVCVNDSGGVKQASHLLKYDSTMGTFAADVKVRARSLCTACWPPQLAQESGDRRGERRCRPSLPCPAAVPPAPLTCRVCCLLEPALQVTGEDSFSINGKEIKVVSSRDPTKLPWGAMNIDLVRLQRLFMLLRQSVEHSCFYRPDPPALGPPGMLLPSSICRAAAAAQHYRTGQRRRGAVPPLAQPSQHAPAQHCSPWLSLLSHRRLQVIEGTGVFIDEAGAGKHIEAGAKKVRCACCRGGLPGWAASQSAGAAGVACSCGGAVQQAGALVRATLCAPPCLTLVSNLF